MAWGARGWLGGLRVIGGTRGGGVSTRGVGLAGSRIVGGTWVAGVAGGGLWGLGLTTVGVAATCARGGEGGEGGRGGGSVGGSGRGWRLGCWGCDLGEVSEGAATGASGGWGWGLGVRCWVDVGSGGVGHARSLSVLSLAAWSPSSPSLSVGIASRRLRGSRRRLWRVGEGGTPVWALAEGWSLQGGTGAGGGVGVGGIGWVLVRVGLGGRVMGSAITSDRFGGVGTGSPGVGGCDSSLVGEAGAGWVLVGGVGREGGGVSSTA